MRPFALLFERPSYIRRRAHAVNKDLLHNTYNFSVEIGILHAPYLNMRILCRDRTTLNEEKILTLAAFQELQMLEENLET